MISKRSPAAPENLGRRFWSRIRSTWDTWHHLLRHRSSGFLIIALLTLAGFLLAVAGNLGEEFASALLKGENCTPYSLLIIIILITSAYMLGNAAWAVRESFATLAEDTFPSCAEPRSVLVFFVSRQFLINSTVTIPDTGPLHIGDIRLPRTSLLDDASLLDQTMVLNPKAGKEVKLTFSWEMILRGIDPHLHSGALKRVYLIGSSAGDDQVKDPGTFRDLENCAAFLNPYLPKVEIIKWQDHGDFEMVEDMASLLHKLIDHEKKLHSTAEHEICIDFTGGQKPSSAAAAFVTLNRRITVQYVQTNAPKEAHRYDLSFRSAPDGSIGIF